MLYPTVCHYFTNITRLCGCYSWFKGFKGEINLNYSYRPSSYRAANTTSVIKTNQLVMYREIIAVSIVVHKCHKYNLWAECRMF